MYTWNWMTVPGWRKSGRVLQTNFDVRVCLWDALDRVACSLPSAAKEVAPIARASPDLASKVTLTPSPFAQPLKDAQDKTNPQQTSTPQ